MLLGMMTTTALGSGVVPIVSQDFTASLADYTTLATTSSLTSDMSVSRAGVAMMYDSTGKLTYAPNNLLLQSNTFSNAAWTNTTMTVAGGVSDPFGGTNAFTLTANGTNSRLYQNIAGQLSGDTFIQSIWVRRRTGTGSINFHALNVGVGTAIPVTGTWTQYWDRSSIVSANAYPGIYVTTTGDQIDVYFATLSKVTYETSPRSGDQVITTSSAYYGPRLDYDPATLAAKGLLVEGARTNLLPQSNDLTVAPWSVNNVNTITRSGTAVDGTINSYSVVPNTTSGYHRVINTTTFTGAGPHTMSAYVKPNGYSQIAIREDGVTGASAVFTLSGAGTVNGYHSAGGVTASNGIIQSVGNGWYRISVVFTGTLAANSRFALILLNGTWTTGDPNALLWTGDGTSGFLVSHTQVEVGSFLTSYIPTGAASVTRAAETFTLANYQNRLVNVLYTDEQTGGSYDVVAGPSASSPLTVFSGNGWVTALRAYNGKTAGTVATPAWLDVSGITGNRMVVDSTGNLTYAPNNMLLQSNTFTNAAWSKSNGTLTSGVSDPFGGTNAFTWTATAAFADLTQNPASSPGTGTRAIVSLWIRRRTGSGTVTFRTPGTSDSPITITSSWTQVFWVGACATSGPAWLLRIQTSGDEVDIYGATYSVVTYETAPRPGDQVITTSAAYYGPRFDFDPATLAGKGLLIEESRANLALQSEQFNNAAWTVGNLSVSANSTTSPDGTVDADTLTCSATNTAHTIYTATPITVTSGSNYAVSVYVKKNTHRYVLLSQGGTANFVSAVFDLDGGGSAATQTGVGGTSGTLVSTSQTSVGNGWYRLTLVGSTVSVSRYVSIGFANAATGNTFSATGDISFNAAGTESIYAWGVQFELGAFATSYIPTVAASVTRAADVVKLGGTALTAVQGAAGSVVLEISDTPRTSTNVLITASAGGSMPLAMSGNFYTANTRNLFATGSITTNAANRAALGWNASGVSISSNGSVVATDATLIAGNTGNQYLGSAGGSSYFGNQHIGGISFYDQRLPNATLQAKSVVGSSY